ncbi:MAG: hypothetical protein GY804_00970 [Alphaproteobacteria bacterium]|nr:hypothetical protein [Alphaproteobacteria bacterium]
MNIEEIITDQQLCDAWGNANFGGIPKRKIVKYGLLKCAVGYHQGHTSKSILIELGLITEKYRITKKGREYLWLVFNDGSKI